MKTLTQRLDLSPEAEHALFSSPLYTGAKSLARRSTPGTVVVRDGLYWGGLIGRCMGPRQQEAAQLYVTDLKKIEGIYVIDLKDDDGRRLKNRNAHRRIPIPEILIKLGFLDYVKQRRAQGGKALFPEFHEGGASGVGERLRKKFDHYKRNFVAAGYLFHGLRHSFITAMMGSDGVSKHLVQKLVGHRIGGETGDRYFKGFELKVLKDAIDEVGMDGLGHLLPDA